MAFTQGYYSDQSITPLTTSYQQFAFGIEATFLKIKNDDGTNNIILSWDGVNQHGLLKPGEVIDILTSNYEYISLKAAAGTPSYRITAVR